MTFLSIISIEYIYVYMRGSFRIKASVQFDASDEDEFVDTGFIESGSVWTEDYDGKNSRRRRLISA